MPKGTTLPGPWADLEEVQEVNAQMDVDWFAAGGFFRTEIEGPLRGGRLFVTSEQFVGSDGYAAPRLFTVRMVSDEGRVSTVGPFNEMTRADAEALVALLMIGACT